MNQSQDPRSYQIATLVALVVYGLVGLDLEIRPGMAFTILAVALAAQLAGTRLAGLPRFDPKSALISSLSQFNVSRDGTSLKIVFFAAPRYVMCHPTRSWEKITIHPPDVLFKSAIAPHETPSFFVIYVNPVTFNTDSPFIKEVITMCWRDRE